MPYRLVPAIALLFFMTTYAQELTTGLPNPPLAPTHEHAAVRHGNAVSDPYFWLRQKTSPEVVAYLESENAYTTEMTAGLKPLEDKLYTEMLGRIKQTDLGVPVRRGDFLYYTRTEEGKQYPIYCRRLASQLDAPEQIVIDPNQLAKTHKFVGIGDLAYSDDGNWLAYAVDFTGFRQYGLQIKNLRTGVTLPDSAEGVTSVAWAADNRTLFLVTEDKVTKRSDKLWRHVVGSAGIDPV